MKDLEIAVKWSKRFESLLRRRHQASGRGLHELVSSCEKQLENEVVRKLRFIATLRNKLIHEEGYDRMEDRAAFLAACQFCRARLDPAPAWRTWLIVVLIVVLAGVGWLVHRRFFSHP